jgi:arsenate reductase-like glutaredoxin family protein
MLWIKRAIIAIHRWAFMPTIVDPNTVHFSFDWFVEVNPGPQVYLYTYPGCSACEEVRGWLGVEWIPYEELVVESIEPPQILMTRVYQGYRLHKVKNKKTGEVRKVALLPEFPQMELIDSKNTKKILVGIEDMKKQVVIYLANKGVPGFKSPEKTPEDRDAQLNQILNEVV